MVLVQLALSFEAYILNTPGAAVKKLKVGCDVLSRGAILILRGVIDRPKSMYITRPFAPLNDVELV